MSDYSLTGSRDVLGMQNDSDDGGLINLCPLIGVQEENQSGGIASPPD